MQDNALKQWVFDALDGSARLLRFRSGHAAPPTCLTHYGEAGTRLLSAGNAVLHEVYAWIVRDTHSPRLMGWCSSRSSMTFTSFRY